MPNTPKIPDTPDKDPRFSPVIESFSEPQQIALVMANIFNISPEKSIKNATDYAEVESKARDKIKNSPQEANNIAQGIYDGIKDKYESNDQFKQNLKTIQEKLGGDAIPVQMSQEFEAKQKKLDKPSPLLADSVSSPSQNVSAEKPLPIHESPPSAATPASSLPSDARLRETMVSALYGKHLPSTAADITKWIKSSVDEQPQMEDKVKFFETLLTVLPENSTQTPLLKKALEQYIKEEAPRPEKGLEKNAAIKALSQAVEKDFYADRNKKHVITPDDCSKAIGAAIEGILMRAKIEALVHEVASARKETGKKEFSSSEDPLGTMVAGEIFASNAAKPFSKEAFASAVCDVSKAAEKWQGEEQQILRDMVKQFESCLAPGKSQSRTTNEALTEEMGKRQRNHSLGALYPGKDVPTEIATKADVIPRELTHKLQKHASPSVSLSKGDNRQLNAIKNRVEDTIKHAKESIKEGVKGVKEGVKGAKEAFKKAVDKQGKAR